MRVEDANLDPAITIGYLRAALEAAERRIAELDQFSLDATDGLVAPSVVLAERDALKERCSALQHELQREATEADALKEQVRRELIALEDWARQQNAGNAFATQVRMWAATHRAALARLDQQETA